MSGGIKDGRWAYVAAVADFGREVSGQDFFLPCLDTGDDPRDLMIRLLFLSFGFWNNRTVLELDGAVSYSGTGPVLENECLEADKNSKPKFELELLLLVMFWSELF